ncbi:hypothetical protein HPP92_016682 [Vanilla planifolia]|uniref:Saposin B-type domain-containing protein n=1 Tax=Vanilla planifolia TaxID=51239 RepID=A0A835QJB9_VANPL|nr:hypothetical protein HPP92_016682 [Vanilla planifolia]
MRQRPFCFISSVSYSKPPQYSPVPFDTLHLPCEKNETRIEVLSKRKDLDAVLLIVVTLPSAILPNLYSGLHNPENTVKERYSSEIMVIPEGDSGCNSCMETSRKAETTLKEISLLKEFDMLSSEVCHFLPGNFETQCLHKSMMQIRHAKLSLQELFREKSLCNSTGLCIDQPKLQDEVDIFVENKMIQEFEDERACIACRRAIRELLMKMKQPKLRRKIIESLIDYCEESEDDEDLCKQIVYKYAPTVLAKLEKLKSNEMCFMMGMCDEGMALDEILY